MSEDGKDDHEKSGESRKPANVVKTGEERHSGNERTVNVKKGEPGDGNATGDDGSEETPIGDEKENEEGELLEKLQYLQAEYENFKKRTAKDLENVIRFSNEKLIVGLLPIIDGFEASLNSIEDIATMEGFKMIYDNLKKVLGCEGLEEIPALGEAFDPFKHEAVLEVEDNERRENEIVEVIQKGYMLKSKVVRPSKVKVAKHNHHDEKEESETDG
jgi:molecular chaperone GrpE